MEATLTRPRNVSVLPAVLIVIVITTIIVTAIVYGQHAPKKHGDDVVTRVRTCIEQRGPMMTMRNPNTGRDAAICQITDNLYGVMITKDDSEVTAFIKEKMKRLEQVVHYLGNGGYIQ